MSADGQTHFYGDDCQPAHVEPVTVVDVEHLRQRLASHRSDGALLIDVDDLAALLERLRTAEQARREHEEYLDGECTGGTYCPAKPIDHVDGCFGAHVVAVESRT